MSDSQFSRTITVLPVRDIAKATVWYKRALGLETVYLHKGDHEGEPTNYAVMERDGLSVHLILDERPEHGDPWTNAGTGYLYLKVSDVEAVFEEVEASGVNITRGIAREEWGFRGFNLTDPSGNAVHVEQEK